MTDTPLAKDGTWRAGTIRPRALADAVLHLIWEQPGHRRTYDHP